VGAASELAVYQAENAVKVTNALSAYLNGDFEPAIELCSDDIVWRSLAESEHAPFGGVYHGRSGVRDYFNRMHGAYEITSLRIVDVIPAGDEVIHVMRLESTKRDGSAEGWAFTVGRWRFKNGLAVAYMDFFNVPASIQTSSKVPLTGEKRVTADPSFAVYQNENAVRASLILHAYRSGDTGPLFEALHPNVTWTSLSEPRHARFGGLFRGTAAVRTYFRRLSETLVLDSYEVVDVIPAGPQVVHVADIKAHTVDEPIRALFIRLVCVWDFEDGRITGLKEYFDVPAYWAQLKR
jgi:uncharacterized protein